MSELSKRSTIYLDPDLHQALRLKAASTHQSVSEIVNGALRQALREDQQDLADFASRVEEPTLSYEALLKTSRRMASFRLRFKQSGAKDLRDTPKEDVARILERIDALAEYPRPPGSEKLSTQERYRIRQGVYRILYEIEDGKLVIVVVKVGHRREVYR